MTFHLNQGSTVGGVHRGNHVGVVLDYADPRAWRKDPKYYGALPFRIYDGGKCDTSWGYYQPTDLTEIKQSIAEMTLKGAFDKTKDFPVLWDFDGWPSIHWEVESTLICLDFVPLTLIKR